MNRASLALLVPFLGLACAPPAAPSGMSALEHDEHARRATQAAEIHQAKVEARRPDRPCGAAARVGVEDPCWTGDASTSHLEHAEQYRQMAAAHRAASQALREAEAKACTGISEADREMSPFAHGEDIESVEAYSVMSGGKMASTRMNGVRVVFRAVPGLTAQWLQRSMECHLARNASLGHDVPEMAYCPLALRHVVVSVNATRTGFAVTVTSSDPETAREVARRAARLR
jgi:hypothetical protein